MNSAKPCRCLNFRLYGFQSSAAECPSLQESMSAADDDLLKRRGGGVRDNSLGNFSAQKSAFKNTFMLSVLRKRSLGSVFPPQRRMCLVKNSRFPSNHPYRLTSSADNAICLPMNRIRCCTQCGPTKSPGRPVCISLWMASKRQRTRTSTSCPNRFRLCRAR